MLNTDFKVLVKISADYLQTALPSRIGLERCCTVKDMTIQESLHLVRTSIEKVNSTATLINFDQSKAFDRVDHGFLETVLPTARFGLDFRG